jgi:hypothetical protein
MNTEERKSKRMGAALRFLERYHQQGDDFFDQMLVVTGDETWVSHNIAGNKRQYLELHHHNSPSKPVQFKQTLSSRKILVTVFGTGEASCWWTSHPKAKP